MDFFKVADFDSAKSVVRECVDFAARGAEVLPLERAIGARAACDVRATESLPEYNRSTVDGYAVRAANTYGATDSIPSLLKLVGRVDMGVVGSLSLHSGETAYVPTGGAVPDGADAVVMLEHTAEFDESLAVYKPASVGENVIRAGDDVESGDLLLHRGEVVTPQKAGLLAALGQSVVSTVKPLRVAVISTGDEIVSIDGKTQVGQIRDTNTTINAALCKQAGLNVVSSELVKDGFEPLKNALSRALEAADIVLVSGGSSIGTRDYTEQVLEDAGEILVHGIALKPGKPTLIARANGKLVLGLPGHPMACLLTLKLLLLDTLGEQAGDASAPFVFARTTINFPSSPGRLTVQPVSLEFCEDGVAATPLFYKSGLVSILAEADGYALIPAVAEGVARGERIKVFLLR